MRLAPGGRLALPSSLREKGGQCERAPDIPLAPQGPQPGRGGASAPGDPQGSGPPAAPGAAWERVCISLQGWLCPRGQA